jgi:hypothetical protein
VTDRAKRLWMSGTAIKVSCQQSHGKILSSSHSRARKAREPGIHRAMVQAVKWIAGSLVRIAQERRDGENSRDDVGRDLIFDEGDAIAQVQLALLESLHHQQIRRRRLMQRVDGRVEIAVLLLQSCKLCVEFALVFVGHGCVLKNKHGEVAAGSLGISVPKYPPSTLAAQVKTVP